MFDTSLPKSEGERSFFGGEAIAGETRSEAERKGEMKTWMFFFAKNDVFVTR